MATTRFVLQGLDRENDHIEALKHVFSLEPIHGALIATAFMNAAGASMLVDLIGDNRDRTRLFVGVRNGVTTIQALELLLRSGIHFAAVDTATQAFIFHPKVYLSYNDRAARIIVGSANATTGGLARNVEASLCLDCRRPEDNELIGSIYDQFNSLRRNHQENVFVVSTINALSEMDAAGLLVDETVRTWRAETRSRTGERTENRSRMRLNTRSIPRATRPADNVPIRMQEIEGSHISIETVASRNLLWRSGGLKRRDLNIPTGDNTNRTGSMLLKKGDPSQEIDQRTYFRHVVFANEEWGPDPRRGYEYMERCVCPFRIVIKGIDYGIYNLRLSHNTRTDTRTYEQKNSMTQIHWGTEVLGLIAREDLLDCICTLYAKDEQGCYTLVFDEE